MQTFIRLQTLIEHNKININCNFEQYWRLRSRYPNKSTDDILLLLNGSKKCISIESVDNAQKKRPLKTPYQFAMVLINMNTELNFEPYSKGRLLREAKWFINKCGDTKLAQFYLEKFQTDVLPKNSFGFKYVWACVENWKEKEQEFYKVERTKISKNSIF